MKVKEVADLVGISVRTLHHYDEIGLLIPDEVSEAGYRLYSDDNLEALQQILFFKELGFSLKKIKEILSDPTFDRGEALHLHQKLLLEKRKRLDQMIMTVEKTMRHMKGEMKMTKKEKFACFDFSDNPYEEEARQRWGEEAVDRANNRIEEMSKEEKGAFEQTFNEIYRQLAAIRHLSPASSEAQKGIKEWFDFLNSFGNYSPQAFKGLGKMYVDDERFTKNIDQFGEGLAEFMCKAMEIYADEHS